MQKVPTWFLIPAMLIAVAIEPLHASDGQADPPKQDDAGTQSDPTTDDGLADLIRHQEEERERARRWKPITEYGNPDPMVDIDVLTQRRELEFRAQHRRYAQQMEALRRKHFRSPRNVTAREQGLDRLFEFTDPAAFRPMMEEFVKEDDDLRLAILDFFNEHGDEGQGALAWTAIYSTDPALRNEAQKRMVVPSSDPVKLEIEMALRSGDEGAMRHAGTLAGALGVVEAIPLLIFAQAGPPAGGGGSDRNQGDLAWIAIQTQHAYVAGLQPVAGDASAGFAPILGIVSEGSILRVVDAVAIIYRTEIHYSLSGLVRRDYGDYPEDLGYDPNGWMNWYNNAYVPYKNEQAAIEDMADGDDAADG